MSLKSVVIIGAEGFIGKNLVDAFRGKNEYEIIPITRKSDKDQLDSALARATYVFHLAGVNRPSDPSEFRKGNVEFTEDICSSIRAGGNSSVPIVMTSSIQADLDNDYGRSKLGAENTLQRLSSENGNPSVIYRLPNVFGKWCRPNYNSVVATFCYNIARSEPITVSDPNRELELVYIDDVVAEFLRVLSCPDKVRSSDFHSVKPTYRITLGDLAQQINGFAQSRKTLEIPFKTADFSRKLYSTYLSYLPTQSFSYDLPRNSDSRGVLSEFLKGSSFGQIFVSRTKPGITRGNHYHHSKTEKFLVVEGDAIVRFRHVLNGDRIEYKVSGHELKVVDIPPGYTHHIENVGSGEMVVLFWADSPFDPKVPDTYALPC